MDLTAMIDVVLLLIIFFVLGTEFAPMLRTPVELPREKGALGEGGPAVLLVDVTSEGKYKYAGEEIAIDRLMQIVSREAKRARAAGPATGGGEPATKASTPRSPGRGLDVLVRADRKCSARHLNLLAASLAASGVNDWKLAVSAAGGGASGGAGAKQGGGG